jgi:WhiB family transcriptional regulator, redox-sensing transcriptional regulator
MAESHDQLFRHPATADIPAWLYDAACRGMDVSIFYRPDNERGTAARRRDQRAKAVCATCSVAARCLDWALTNGEPYGIWGGLTPDERARLGPR